MRQCAERRVVGADDSASTLVVNAELLKLALPSRQRVAWPERSWARKTFG